MSAEVVLASPRVTTYHEPLVKIRSQKIVDELSSLIFLFGPSRLVLEHNIVIPPEHISLASELESKK